MSPTFTRDGERFETGERVPVLPLRDVVVFPYVVIPLLVGRAASLTALEAAAADDNVVLLVAQRSGEVQEPSAADLHRVGVVARIHQLARLPNGTTKVLVEGVARARVTRYAPAQAYLRAAVAPEPFADAAVPATEDVEPARRRAVALF